MMTVIGLMSGTSMDGIDLALVHTDGLSQLKFGGRKFFAYSTNDRGKIEQSLEDAARLTQRSDRPGNLADVELLIDQLHASAVKSFLEENAIAPSKIDVIGYHGQTVLHRPEEKLTVQLGDGERLAKLTETPVVWDMRANDVENGGQGAPLVPIYHEALAANLPERLKNESPVAFVNIGGISNITMVSGDQLIAFDCGPGNALIDQWVQMHAGVQYDLGGLIAAEGRVDKKLIDRYMRNPFFEKAAPKSLDRNDFQVPKPEEISLEDGARTLARLTATAIMESLDGYPVPPTSVIISGGGRNNHQIMMDLVSLGKERNIEVLSAEQAGLDGDFMEAEAWGYLAVRSLKGFPLTYPGTTGVEKPLIGGKHATP